MFATDTPLTAVTPPDAALSGEGTRLEQLHEQSLKASGYSYMIGDAALAAAGFLSGRHKEAASGLLYGAGGLVLATCGNPSTEKRLQMLYQDMGKYLQQQGVSIPAGTHAAEALSQPGGVVGHIEKFLYSYPSQILNTLFAAGGVQMLRSGLQHQKGWDTASGALVAAGGLVGLLVNERKPDPQEHARKGLIGKAMDWVQEKPLRLSGYLYMGNNATLLMSAMKERKADPGQHSYLLKLLTVASYVVANSLFAMSSKDNISCKEKLDPRALDELEHVAAEVIAAQPRPMREQLINQMAAYLSAQSHTSIPVEELARAMHERVEQQLHPSQPQQSWQSRLAFTPGERSR